MQKLLKLCAVSLAVLIISALTAINAAAEELPDLGLDEYDLSLPDSITQELDKNGITPEKIDSESLSIESILSYIINLITENLKKPVALLLSLFGIILLCSISNVFASTSGSGAKNVFAVCSVLAGAAMMTASVSDAVCSAQQTLETGSVFISSFIPAFAGIVAMSGRVSSAAVFNSIVMGGAQIYMQLAANVLMPITTAIMSITLAGSVNTDLKLDALSSAAKKIIIWVLGLIMTVFVALLGIQSFITVPADTVGLKAARFTVANGVPFVGSAISDALSVMQGGIHIIRGNFGTFGIIAGAVLIFPSIISAVCYKFVLTLGGAISDLFGLSSLSALIRSAEGVMSIVVAMLACFLLMTIISISLMIYIAGGAL